MAGVGHIAVGMAAARWTQRLEADRRHRARIRSRGLVMAMVMWPLLSMLPDVDVAGFYLGVPHGSPWGHRGVTHSLAFAVLVGAVVALVTRLRNRGPALRFGALAALVVASHGLLDTLTDGGSGLALLWPWDDSRFFAPVNPIPVSPIGLGLISRYGLYVAAFELLLFAPLLAYAWWPRRRVVAGERAAAR